MGYEEIISNFVGQNRGNRLIMDSKQPLRIIFFTEKSNSNAL